MKITVNRNRTKGWAKFNFPLHLSLFTHHLSLFTFLLSLCPLHSLAATVETDRTWYLAGEAMTVSVTDDNALIAYAELCDTQGLAAGVVVGLRGGVGRGVIELPPNLHSGYYVLSVYTRHHAQVSHRLVAVVNTLHKSADDDVKWVKADSCWATAVGTAQLVDKKDVDVRETEGHILKARVKNVREGHTFKGSQIGASLSIIGKQIHYFEGQMVDDSTAVFYTYGIHGKLPLVLAAQTATGVSLPVELRSPFAALLPSTLPHLVFHYQRSEVEARSLAMQRHQMAIAPAKREAQLGVTADDTAEEGVLLDYDNRAFGTLPYLSYNLDEYRQFLTVREVLLEYVECVNNKRVNGVPRLTVHTRQTPEDSTRPTLVLIDGMPVSDVERLLNYDARRIHHINIYDSQFTFGGGIYNGILSFVTRSGRLTNYPTEPLMQYVVYDFPQ